MCSKQCSLLTSILASLPGRESRDLDGCATSESVTPAVSALVGTAVSALAKTDRTLEIRKLLDTNILLSKAHKTIQKKQCTMNCTQI